LRGRRLRPRYGGRRVSACRGDRPGRPTADSGAGGVAPFKKMSKEQPFCRGRPACLPISPSLPEMMLPSGRSCSFGGIVIEEGQVSGPYGAKDLALCARVQGRTFALHEMSVSCAVEWVSDPRRRRSRVFSIDWGSGEQGSPELRRIQYDVVKWCLH